MKKKEILSLFTLHYSKLTLFRLISVEKLLLRRTFGNLNCSVVNECEEARESSTFSSFFQKWIKKGRIVIVMVEGWKRGRISTSTIWHRIEKKNFSIQLKKGFMSDWFHFSFNCVMSSSVRREMEIFSLLSLHNFIFPVGSFAACQRKTRMWFMKLSSKYPNSFFLSLVQN